MGALSGSVAADCWFTMDSESKAGAVRRAAVELGQAIGLPETRRADLAIVATELATNLIKHARDGVLLIRPVRREEEAGVELVCMDSGPGMASVAHAAQDGRSTAGTLGIGLGAVVRLADRYDVHSQPERGTVGVAQLWRRPPTDGEWAAGLARPLAGEELSGDCFAVRAAGERYQVMVADGLGRSPRPPPRPPSALSTRRRPRVPPPSSSTSTAVSTTPGARRWRWPRSTPVRRRSPSAAWATSPAGSSPATSAGAWSACPA
jgi:anti-sigma regulatory factor (Ser/Thr protein kinase)